MALALLARAPLTGAQVVVMAADTSGEHHDRQRIWSVWSASARGQPLATRLGYRYDRGLVLVGLQKRWPLAESESGALALAYTVDLLPIVMSTEMPDYVTRDVPCGAGAAPGCWTQISVLAAHHTAYGVGASPVGFVGRWKLSPALGLQLRASGGMIYFSRVIPDPLGCQLNFTADAGVATDVRIAGSLALVAGYRLNHISNGGRGKVNPGMNSRMLELGLSLAR